uniref:DNA-binding protein HU n=1 Tax=Lygus hesperus TaxID=30085 RepID=A0A0A9X736_LYGHE
MLRFFKFVAFMCFASLSNANPWVDEIVKTGQRTLVQCRRNTGVFEKAEEDLGESVIRLKDCLRSAFVDSLDELVASPEIPISDYVSLVSSNSSARESKGRADPDDDLLTTVTNKMYAILDTHSIKLSLSPFEDTEAESQVEGRRRRFRRMFPMIVAGFMLMAAFVVPLGFQFMAMIGGKALLLSKLAFFSALYSGYRRVTTDLDFHHHHPEPFHHHAGFHHRQDNVQPQTYQFVRS